MKKENEKIYISHQQIYIWELKNMVKMKKIALTLLAIFLVSVFLGCVQKQPETATPTVAVTAQKTPETEITGLAPDGKVIYKYMTENKYQSWEMWPGKGQLYPTTAHGAAFLTTYVNDVALATIKGKTGTMKEDSVIVKENYNANKTLVALTVMFKENGYDPAHKDWFWAKYAPNGTILAEGKGDAVKACIECHEKKDTNDYIFTSELK